MMHSSVANSAFHKRGASHRSAACNATGAAKSALGVRKIGATRAPRTTGATLAELEAIFGWRGGGMASLARPIERAWPDADEPGRNAPPDYS
jgi:hypothetical protein